MPFETNLFNKNQRVWVLFETGDMACKVVGKHRGRNRYIQAWVTWGSKSREQLMPEQFDEFEVTDDFVRRHHLSYIPTANRAVVR